MTWVHIIRVLLTLMNHMAKSPMSLIWHTILTEVKITCTTISWRSQHVMHTIGIQHKCGIWDVILPSCLGQRQSFFQHREDCFSHRLRSPRLKWSTFTEPQIMHQALVCVPALLPHWLKLVLVAVCWKMAIRTTENNSQWSEIKCHIQKQ